MSTKVKAEMIRMAKKASGSVGVGGIYSWKKKNDDTYTAIFEKDYVYFLKVYEGDMKQGFERTCHFYNPKGADDFRRMIGLRKKVDGY